MATNYPSSLDNSVSLPYPTATSATNSPSLSGGQDNQNDAVIAVQTLLGTNSSQTNPGGSGYVLQATSTIANTWGLLTAANTATLSGSGAYIFGTSPTIQSPIIFSPTIAGVTFTGSLGTITVSTLTASGTITANGGITASNGITASGGTVSILPYLSNPYKFSVYLGTNGTSTTSQAVLVYDTKTFDTGSNYSTSTGKFTAPVAGFYLFDASYVTNSGSNATVNIYLYQNSTEVGQMGTLLIEATQPNQSVEITKLLQLSANDTVEVKIVNGTGSLTVVSGGANTWFEGFLVSAT